MNESLVCGKDFDIVINDSGFVSLIDGPSSVANMMLIDFISNNDWELDSDLGLNWFNKDDTGLLQRKGNEVLIVNELQRKIEGIHGVREIKEISINNTVSRKLIIDVTIIADDGSEFMISNRSEVS